MNKIHHKKLLSSLFFLTFFFSTDAHAYINPSLFSMVALLLAGFLSVIGFYFYRIVNTIKSIFAKIKLFLSKN